MKIKLLACVVLAAILSSCTDENQITPKEKVSTLKGPEHLHGVTLKETPEKTGLESTNFNNSWPLAK